MKNWGKKQMNKSYQLKVPKMTDPRALMWTWTKLKLTYFKGVRIHFVGVTRWSVFFWRMPGHIWDRNTDCNQPLGLV